MDNYCKLPLIVRRELNFGQNEYSDCGYLISLSSNLFSITNHQYSKNIDFENDESLEKTESCHDVQDNLNKTLQSRLQWLNKHSTSFHSMRKKSSFGDRRRKISDTVVLYSSIIEPPKKKIRKCNYNEDFDCNLSYENFVRNRVHCNDDNDAKIVSKLAHSAYHQKINSAAVCPIIQRFVGKEIGNSMTARKSRSKIKIKKEKNLEKKFIEELRV